MDLSLTPSSARGSGAAQLLEQTERWLSKPWVPWVINLAMLILLTASLAQWTWRVWQPSVTPPARTPATAADIAPEYNINALTAANLFGQAAPAASQVSLENIPLSSLNLSLTGVMVTPAGSFALISADGGPELPVSVGQEITGGVVLHEVYADRALIRRGGATESLMLKEGGPPLPNGSIVTQTRQPPPRPAPGAATAEVQKLGNNAYAIEREQINKQMQRPEFLSQALMVPNAGGGFLVREIQPGSLYEKLGLRVGDVINSVNGQAVNTVEDVMKIYQQLSGANNASQVTLDVRRAGKNESLQYNINN
mgnify:CR=1 FL=1